MTTSINTNVSAYFAQNNLRSSSAEAQSSIARLSSGNRIIRASDDVAALSIGTVLRTDVSTLKTALSNTSQAISLIQVADGALQRLGEILQRQKALSVQGNADTLSDTERGYLNQEFSALTSEYDRIVTNTNFNGIALLDGSLASSSNSLAAEELAATTGITAAYRTGETADTAIIASAAAIVLSNNGTAVNNDTANALIGSLEGVTVSGNALLATGLNFTLTANIGGINYTSASIDAEVGGAIVFTAGDGSGVTLTITLADPDASDGSTDGAFTATNITQGDVDSYAALVQTELRKLEVFQNRVLENSATTDSSAITAEKFDGTILQGMTGANFTLRSGEYDITNGNAPSISSFSFTPASGSNILSGSVVVGGETFSFSDVDITSATFDTLDAFSAGNGVMRFTNVNNSNEFLDITLSGALANLDLQSDTGIVGIENALNAAFGSGATGGAAFQVGTSSSDTINIAISNVSSTSVYKDDDGVSTTLSVGTKADSIIASGVLDNAINNLTSVRAEVGAVQSRFNFAAATLETSVQNLDSARAGFLDADISNESTAFASQQVLIQASISVLAQANQLPQNLLKLIG